MEDLYLEMLERLEYLQEQIETDEIKWRKAECTLAIVRVQQLLLSNLNSKNQKEILTVISLLQFQDGMKECFVNI